MENEVNAINDLRRKGITNFGLAGRLGALNALDKTPLKPGIVYNQEQLWNLEISYMLKNAKTKQDLNNIGLKINEGIDNNYANVYDYQYNAVKKMTEIKGRK